MNKLIIATLAFCLANISLQACVEVSSDGSKYYVDGSGCIPTR